MHLFKKLTSDDKREDRIRKIHKEIEAIIKNMATARESLATNQEILKTLKPNNAETAQLERKNLLRQVDNDVTQVNNLHGRLKSLLSKFTQEVADMKDPKRKASADHFHSLVVEKLEANNISMDKIARAEPPRKNRFR